MQCTRCNKNVKTLFGISFVHKCSEVIPVVKQSVFDFDSSFFGSEGTGQEWAKTVYGEFYANSTSVYSAIKLRATSLSLPELKVYRKVGEEDVQEVPSNHPLKGILTKVNPWWTMDDLWIGTSTYLDAWGSAFWVTTDRNGIPTSNRPEQLWLLRPDKMKILPDKNTFVKGFIYGEDADELRLLPEEVVWFRLFNPLDEYAGLSPMAPLRLSVEMSQDALKMNRNVFKDGLLSDTVITVEDAPTEEELVEFDKRLRWKYAGTKNSHRPLILAGGMDVKRLGLSAREFQYLETLRWSLEDVSRVYGVPKILLQDLENSTFSNFDLAEKIFWRDTMIPYMGFLSSKVNEFLVPKFGENLFVEFSLENIEALAEDETEVQEREIKDVMAGIKTINEVRERRGLEPVDWGDVWWADTSKMPIFDDTSPDVGHSESSFPSGINTKKFPKLTPSFLSDRQKEHDRIVGHFSDLFKPIQNKLFERQLRDILRKVRQTRSVDDFVFNKELDTFEIKQSHGESLFNPSDWRESFDREGRSTIRGSLVAGANAEIAAFGLGFSFDVSVPVVQDWIDDSIRFWSTRVNTETAKLLMNEIRVAQELGESVPEITKRIEKLFVFNSKVRSEMIARTEIQGSVNRGAFESYQQSNVVESKRWLATNDPRTRDTHSLANGQEVPLDVPFIVGGFSLMHPGDRSAPPEETIQCRCTMIPVISERRSYLSSKDIIKPKQITEEIVYNEDGMPYKKVITEG